MRFPITISVLLLALAPVVRAQSASDNLADVARQSRVRAVHAKHTWDDQNSDFGRSTDDTATPCGAPLDLQDGFVSALLGKDNVDPDLAKALVRWLDKHPDLDTMPPEDIARVVFPLTASQAQQNLVTAKGVADQWIREAQALPNPDNQSESNPAVNMTYTTTAQSTLSKAVEAEQERRVRSDGSAADKLQEAVNIYSICDSRRRSQFESDIDKLAKQQYQTQVPVKPETKQGK